MASLILALSGFTARGDVFPACDYSAIVVDDQGELWDLGTYPSGYVARHFGSGLPGTTDIALGGYVGVTATEFYQRSGSGVRAVFDLSADLQPGDQLNALVDDRKGGFYATGTAGYLYQFTFSPYCWPDLCVTNLGPILADPAARANSGGDLAWANKKQLLWANSNGDLWDVWNGTLVEHFIDSAGNPLRFDGLATYDYGGPLYGFFDNHSKHLDPHWWTPTFDYPFIIRGATFSIPEPKTIVALATLAPGALVWLWIRGRSRLRRGSQGTLRS
ncbi:MAG: hypothetical protein EHM42_11330 [Planctomycetaceae bacterium]|nr:MAG: hypothetical protein EHM42_11330 [Planctomycetaceae bacterium]